MKKGIDVAKWQGIIDWKKVKEEGVQFAVLKIIDKQCDIEDLFERNYHGAISHGIPVDVYNYSYATTVNKATQDANATISAAKGKNIEYIWLDVEDKCQQSLGMTLIDIINAYQSVITAAGYKFGVYTGLSFYNTLIKPYHKNLDCPFWMARYPSSAQMNLSENPSEEKKPEILHSIWGWQYTSKGKINGINGNVDLNIKYDDLKEKNKENKIATYSFNRDGEKRISENFKVKEFRCKDGSDKILIDTVFVAEKLQAIRNYFGVPVTINSAYRTKEYNESVGGAAKSYHLSGKAFDISVKGKAPVDVAKYAKEIGVNGIIQYNGFVHIDNRTKKYWARNNNGKITVLNDF